MDQALYEQLKEARDQAVASGQPLNQDLKDFNTLEAGGEFAQFQPTTTSTTTTPATTTTSTTQLPKIGDTVDFTKRPDQVDLSPDPQQSFGQEFREKSLVLDPSGQGDPNEPDPAIRELGRMIALPATAGPALGGTLLHRMTGNRTLGNLATGALLDLEAELAGRALGFPTPVRSLMSIPGYVRSLLGAVRGQQPPPGTAPPGTGPIPPGTPPGGLPPSGAGSPPNMSNWTSYAPSQQPRVINLTRTRPPGSTIH